MKNATAHGFTLLELIVVVAILAILAGAAVPVTSKARNYRAQQATLEELQVLADASAAHFRDTLELPNELADLLVDPERPGWSGPYLPGVVTDRLSGSSGYFVDGWSRRYHWQVVADVGTITSSGRDREFGTEADLSVELNVTPLRRAATLERLDVINAAVRAYNDRHLSTAPLASDWARALEQLIEASLLPRTSVYRVDAWGEVFVAQPRGQRPVVRIGSVHLMNTAELGGGGGATAGPQPGRWPSLDRPEQGRGWPRRRASLVNQDT